MTTSVLFQPAALGGGATLEVIRGGVLSMLIVAVAVRGHIDWRLATRDVRCTRSAGEIHGDIAVVPTSGIRRRRGIGGNGRRGLLDVQRHGRRRGVPRLISYGGGDLLCPAFRTDNVRCGT